MRSIAIAIATATALTSVGCYSTYELSPASLRALEGFREGERRSVDARGGAITFDADTQLQFTHTTSEMPDGSLSLTSADVSAEGPATFSSIQVSDDSFQGVTRRSKENLKVDLSSVASIHARKFSTSKTIAAIVIPIAIVLVTAATTLAVFSASHTCFGACIGSF